MQRIVIVGGGVGGTMLANLLVVRLYPEILGGEVQVLLISDSPDHYYKPAFMYVAFEQFFLEDLKRPQRSLLRPEVMFQLDRVDRFDFPRQELQTRSGRRHGYDYLVIATGCVPAPERIEGLKEAGDHFYQYQPARRLAERLASLESGRVFITVSFPRTPNVPHQCGIAPVETTLMLDDYLRRRGVRERVEIVYTYPTTAQLLRNCLFLQRPTCEILPSLFEQRGIRFQRGFTLARVVVASNIAAEIRLGKPCAIYDGRVQAVAQMGLNAGMPLWYDYRHDVKPTPPTKLGGLLRQGFNRGLYWAVARGML